MSRITGSVAGLAVVLVAMIGPAVSPGQAGQVAPEDTARGAASYRKPVYRFATAKERESLKAAHGATSADRVKYIVLRRKPRYAAVCEDYDLAGTQGIVYRRPHAASTRWTYVTGGSGTGFENGRAARTILFSCFRVM